MTCEDLGRDRYKRIIGRCTVAGEDMGSWMVSQGLPWPIAATRSTMLKRKPRPKLHGVLSGLASS